MDPWEELDALVAELRAANEEWGQSSDALQGQLASFKEHTDRIDAQFAELGISEAMLELSRRALNDAGRLHQSRLNYGLTRAAALLWHALEDPRPQFAAVPPEAMYSIEVRIGPLYLLGVKRDQGAAGDQRLSILIEGEKQLIAPLPTAPAKFRAALLRAFAAPTYVGPPREDAEAETAAPSSESEAAGTEASPPGREAAAAPPPDGAAEAAADQPVEQAPGSGEHPTSEPAAEAEPTASAGTDSGKAARQKTARGRGRRPNGAKAPESAEAPAADAEAEPPDVIELPGSSGAGDA